MVSNEGVEIGSEVEIKWAAHLLQLSVTGIKKARPSKSTGLLEKNIFFCLAHVIEQPNFRIPNPQYLQ